MNAVVVAHRPQVAKPIFHWFGREIGGYQWVDIRGDLFQDADVIKEADILLVWNGFQYNARQTIEIARRFGIPYAVFENGLLGQSKNYFWDSRGFNGDSSLMDAVQPSRAGMDKLERTRTELQEQYPLRPEGHVLVPLQIHNDTQVLYHTSYATMEDFQADLAEMFPEQDVVIRPHPKSTATRQPHGPKQRVETEGSWLEAASRASAVVGLTSTCLWEAAILGVPTFALGDHPLRRHPRRCHDRLLAAALERNLPVDTPIADVMRTLGIQLEPKSWRASSPGRPGLTAGSA